MVDKLQVDLVAGNAAKATADVQGFEQALVRADRTAKSITFGKDWDKQVAAVERRTLSLAQELKRLGEISLKPGNLAAGLGKAAAAAEADLRRAYARLRQIEQEAASTKDPVVLKRLQDEANKTIATLTNLEAKIANVSAGRKAAAGRAGSGFDIQKAGGAINSAAGLGIPGAVEASSALELAALAGISAGAIAAAGAVTAVGVLAIKLAKDYRAEQERLLHVQEGIAAAANKHLLIGRQLLKDAKTDAQETEFQRGVAQAAANQDIKGLQRRKEIAEQLRELTKINNGAAIGDPEAFKRQSDRIKELDDAIINAQASKSAAADKAFTQNWEDWKKKEEDAKKKRLESVKEGQKAVDDFGKSTDELFGKLFAAQGADNPFVKIYTDATNAIAETRIQTAGLSEDLQKQAIQMTNNANANALFTARLEARLKSSDLRDDARQLRNGRNKPFIDPRILQTPGGFDQFTQDQFANLDAAGLGSGLNVASLIGTLARAKNAPSDQSVSERLDRQLKVIADLRPENEFQRAEADRKIIALTQGVKPEDLTDAQRNAAAAARENEASRLDNAEKDAKAQREAAAEVQKSIDANIQRLADIAERDGLQGVIRIINDAEDVARDSLGQRRRASPADAKSIMD